MFHFHRFVKSGILKDSYKDCLILYFKKNRIRKLKFNMLDASFIKNEHGLRSDKVGRNRYFSNKNSTKISNLVDSNGIVLSSVIFPGNRNDSIFAKDTISSILIDIFPKKHQNHNRCKQYLLADGAYYSNDIINSCKLLGYHTLIPQNKHVKDPKKIITWNKYEKSTYSKRIKVENHFCWIKKNRRLKNRYERYSENFGGFLYLAYLKLISKYL